MEKSTAKGEEGDQIGRKIAGVKSCCICRLCWLLVKDIISACPVPDMFDDEAGPSKKLRFEHIPMPPMPPPASYAPPVKLTVPDVSLLILRCRGINTYTSVSQEGD